jgi:hypothetical protein
MSIFRIKIDFGPKGTTKSDEIFCDGFSISWPEILEECLGSAAIGIVCFKVNAV